MQSSDPPTEAAVDAAMLTMDPDGDGTIDFDEFNAWWQGEKAGTEAVSSANAIQRHFRGLRARREQAEEKVRIVNLQMRIRQKLARKHLARKRRLLAEEAEGKERRGREKAARQAAADEAKRLASAEDTLRMEQEEAAAKIQAIHRGRKGRRTAAEEYMRQVCVVGHSELPMICPISFSTEPCPQSLCRQCPLNVKKCLMPR